jgi:transcriptional regulator with GAF, ATPase, and Fis domain
LRQRREDVPALAENALRRADPQRQWILSLGVRRMLLSPSLGWSGNMRQLERVVIRARARALARDPEASELVPEHFEARDLDGISPSDASTSTSSPPAESEPSAAAWQQLQAARARLDEAEQMLVRRALSDASGVVAQAARTLGVARTTLSSRLDVLGLRGRGKVEG